MFNTASGLQSTFHRQPTPPDPLLSSNILLKLAAVSVSADACDVQVTWPADVDPRAASIAHSPFQRGKMKNCYKVCHSVSMEL